MMSMGETYSERDCMEAWEYGGLGGIKSQNPPTPPHPHTPILKIAVTLLLASLLSINTARAQRAVPSAGVQIITAEEIGQAGLARLSDLFLLIDDWHTTSVEGYAFDVSANGLAAAQEAAWMVLVDGIPVDLRILDAQNLNTLPLSLTEIDAVEVYNTPALVNGVFAPAGLLHFHTRTPDPGAALRLGLAAGNEIGDPGPFRYTAFTSPNIDRIGPIFQGAASVADSTWHARVHVKLDEHHATDERIRERVFTFYQGIKEPRLLLSSGGLDLGTTGRLGRHNVYAGFSRFQDLPFFEPVGVETPTDHRFAHAGLHGDTDPGESTGLSYRLSYTASELEPRDNKGSVNFDWRQNTVRGHYEVRSARGLLRGALGLSFDRIESVAGADLDDASLSIPRAYGRAGYRADDRWDAHLTAHITRVKGQKGFGALATVQFTPTPIHTIVMTGSVARQPFQATNSLWYWMGEGYAFSARRQTDISLPTGYRAETTYTADLVWTIRPSDRFNLTLFGGYRRFDDQTMASYAFRYDSLNTGFFTDTDVVNNVSGRVTKVGADLRVWLIPSLEQRFYYAYARYPASDDTFFQAWRSQPWHRVRYTVRYAPNPRLSLYARLAYRSETQWTAFQEAARDSGGRYEANLPGFWLLDLAAQKRFWRDHLQLSLSLRNFLNEAYRAHAAGAITNMAFHVRLHLFLN